MKRLLAAGVLAALFLVPVVALATSSPVTAPHYVQDVLQWRVHKATAGTGEVLRDDANFTATGTGCNACMVDSVITNRVGVAAASSVLDTSVAINTTSWWVPQPTGVAADSATALYFQFIAADPTGASCESGADSLHVAIQGSFDGMTWVTLNTFCGSTGTGYQASLASRNTQTAITGQFQGLLSLNGAALSVGAPVWVYKIYRRNAAQQVMGYDVPDRCSCDKFPLLRFVLNIEDAKGYKLKCYVGHYTVNE